MTCKVCKKFDECMAEADFLWQVFAPNYDGEHYCGEFSAYTNADRIRAMSDEELAWELMTWRIETEAKHHGIESTYPNTQAAIREWLQRPAKEATT